QIEQHTFCGRHTLEHGRQQVAAPAADVTDRLEPREVVGGENGGDLDLRLGRHRRVEYGTCFRVLCEVGPEAAGDNLLARRKAGAYGLLHLPEGAPEGGQAEHPYV